MTDSEPTPDDRTLHVSVGAQNRLRNQTKEMLRATESGDDPAGIGHVHVLNFESEAELAELGVIDLVSDGRSKRPVAQYDDIQVHYSLVNHDAAREGAGA